MWLSCQQSFTMKLPWEVRMEVFGVRSLTKRISSKGIFKVELINQSNSKQQLEEAFLLNNLGKGANIRTVIIYCDEVPVILARSVLPLKKLKREWLQFIRLGNKSLGSWLHSCPSIKQQPPQISKIRPKKYFHNLTEKKMWARRTVYSQRSTNVLVTEIFLPEYWQKVKVLENKFS